MQPAPRGWTLAAAIVGSSMVFVDGTVVNVALPAIQQQLGADAAQAQWVIESYALFLAALLLVGGALGDHFGRRRVFLIGVAIFSIAAIACALSRGIQQLIAARALQGIGGSLLVPGSLALISGAYPEADRGRAIGTWSGASAVAAAVGPVIGGFMIDHASWRWAFWINLPLGLVLLLLAGKIVETRAHDAKPLDLMGAVLATAGLAGIVFALIEAPVRGRSSPLVLGSVVAGVAALAAFLVAQRRSDAPMVDFALFRNRDFSGANLLTLALYAALGGGLYFFPLNLIQVQGYGATAAGGALLPFVVIMFVLSPWAGTLVARYGARPPLVIGPGIAAAGFALFAWPGIGGPYWSTFLPAVCVLGLGMAITVAPLTTTVMNSVGSEGAGIASGVNNAVSRVASLLAVAVFGIVMSIAFDSTLAHGLASLNLPTQLADTVLDQRTRLAAIELPEAAGPHADAIRYAIDEAFVAGFRRVMMLCAGLALASAAAAWIFMRKPAAARP